MITREGTIPTFDGLELYYTCRLPDRKATANLAMVHGYGDHVARHLPFAQRCAEAGIAFWGIDLRGHGRSPGQRGFIRSWDDYLGDTDTLLELAGRELPGLPLFLLGHSMGGVIVLDYAERRSKGLSGVIATSPELGTLPVAPALVLIAKVLSSVWPRFAMKTPLDLAALSRNADVGRAAAADPLYHNTGTARLGTELIAAVSRVRKHAKEIGLPLLMLQGGADRIAPPDATRSFFDEVPEGKKELLFYENAYHELDLDSDGERASRDLFAWVARRLRMQAAKNR